VGWKPILMLEVRRPACVVGHRLPAPVVLAFDLRPRRPIPLRNPLARRAKDVLCDRADHGSTYPLVLRVVNVSCRRAIHRCDVPFRVEGVAEGTSPLLVTRKYYGDLCNLPKSSFLTAGSSVT